MRYKSNAFFNNTRSAHLINLVMSVAFDWQFHDTQTMF